MSFTIFVFALFTLLPSSAYPFAFERPIRISSEFSGAAEIAASLTSGSEAIFYNPAGLARGDKNDISIGSSYIENKSNLQLEALGSFDESRINNRPLFDNGFIKMKLFEKIWLGFGHYSAANINMPLHNGGEIIVNGISFSRESKFAFSETAIGIGFLSNEHVSIGATIRYQKINITQLQSTSSNSSGETEVSQSSHTGEGTGFSMGIQFSSEDKKSGLGLSYRNNIEMTTEGTLVSASENLSDPEQNTSDNDQVSNVITLGEAFNLALHHQIYENFILLFGLGATLPNFERNSRLSILAPNLNAIYSPRFGVEYLISQNFKVRIGFVTTSKANSDLEFIPSGKSNTHTAGVTTMFLDGKLKASLSIAHTSYQATFIRVIGADSELVFNQNFSSLSGHLNMKFLF